LNASHMPKRQRWVVGLAAAALGLVGAAAMYLRPEQLRVPAWVGFSAMAGFVGVGGALIASACEARKLEGWLGVLTVLGLLVPATWIAIGPGPMACSVSLPFFTTAAADWMCRRAFGLGALLGLIILILAVRRAVRHGP
jgi:hypothetical protein